MLFIVHHTGYPSVIPGLYQQPNIAYIPLVQGSNCSPAKELILALFVAWGMATAPDPGVWCVDVFVCMYVCVCAQSSSHCSSFAYSVVRH